MTDMDEKFGEEYNQLSLDTLCAGLCYALGIEPPAAAAPAASVMTEFIDGSFGGRKADRIFMYNPDAVAQWIYEKYPCFVKEVGETAPFALPMRTVMPSVTPVCFGTMYTGAQPEVHGIRRYEKPVIRTDSIFDALIRAGRKPAIVATTNCSMSKIYHERDMDYFIYPTIGEVNNRAMQLIAEDRHDFIAVYNGNYDSSMHKHGPEGPEALAELRCNARAFQMFGFAVREKWKKHDTLLGFAMDHGCHEIDGGCGSHGLDMPEDLNICHRYAAIPAEAGV